MDKIKIIPIELSEQRPTEIRESWIQLFDNHLEYRIDFTASEPAIKDDPDSGWTDGVINKFDIVALKKNIAGIEKCHTLDKKWGIYIIVSGFARDIKVYYRTEPPAQQLYEKLLAWLVQQH